MNAFLKSAVAFTLLMSTSISMAATVTCKGVSDAGSNVTFKRSSLPDGTVRVSIHETQDGNSVYKHSWISDQTSYTQRVNGVMLEDSSGDRGEFFSRLSLTGEIADVFYEENDSGWEYSIQLSQVHCETK